ncbi:ATP-binding cassette domain-containing protein [Mycoplasmatota bacterium WC44]
MSREVVLDIKNIDVHFKNGKRVVKAVNNVSFQVFRGETFGLVGESGSGKTTISRAINRINHLTNGEIIFKGDRISGKITREEDKAMKKKIQMIFQDPAASLNERATVDYIVSEGLYNFKLFETEDERRQKVSDALDSVGLLPEHMSRYPHEFSGGQRQRIGIARALVIEPELILADEPISALDVSIRAQVLNLMRKFQKERGLTYVFVAHDLSIIKYISDRIGVMHNGYMVEMGTSEQVNENPIHPYTRSLLTAIPQPDPRSERHNVRQSYDMTGIDYANSEWIEVEPGHFVLGKREQVNVWQVK